MVNYEVESLTEEQKEALLRETKYLEFDDSGKLNAIEVACHAPISWGTELDISHLNITKQDIENGLTKDQWNGLISEVTSEDFYQVCEGKFDLDLGEGFSIQDDLIRQLEEVRGEDLYDIDAWY